MPKSSIHLQPAKLFAMIHNIRGAYVSYLVDISENNEYDKDFESVLERYNLLKNEAERNYYNRTKQHIQTAKNKYMWEAVVNIKTNHSMGDIQRLAKELEKKYGWKTLQIGRNEKNGRLKSLGNFATMGIYKGLSKMSFKKAVNFDYYQINVHAHKNEVDKQLDALALRLKPILMTMISNALALLPIALAIGTGTQIIQDLAIAIMGGLLFAIVVNLYIIPLFFYYMGRFTNTKT